MVLTCALLHLGFIGFFYGSPSSWANYAYIPVMGVAATDTSSRASAEFVSGLCILRHRQLRGVRIVHRGLENHGAKSQLPPTCCIALRVRRIESRYVNGKR